MVSVLSYNELIWDKPRTTTTQEKQMANQKQQPPKVKVKNPWGKEPYFAPYKEQEGCFGKNN